MSINKEKRLDEIISRIRGKYPYFEYINALKDKGHNHNLGAECYGIIISGIKQSLLKELLNYIDNEIIMPIAETEEDLPLIIPLKGCSFKAQWKWSNLFEDKEGCSNISEMSHPEDEVCAAEDYEYECAA